MRAGVGERAGAEARGAGVVEAWRAGCGGAGVGSEAAGAAVGRGVGARGRRVLSVIAVIASYSTQGSSASCAATICHLSFRFSQVPVKIRHRGPSRPSWSLRTKNALPYTMARLAPKRRTFVSLTRHSRADFEARKLLRKPSKRSVPT